MGFVVYRDIQSGACSVFDEDAVAPASLELVAGPFKLKANADMFAQNCPKKGDPMDEFLKKQRDFAERPELRVAMALHGVARYGASIGGAYHGYKRHDSVWGGIGWFLLGSMFPLLSTGVALGQGYGKPKKKKKKG